MQRYQHQDRLSRPTGTGTVWIVMDSDGVRALIPVCSSIMVEGSHAQLSFGVGDSFSMFDEVETKVKAYECARFVHF